MEYVYSNDPIQSAANLTAEKLKEHLSKGERVLWLLTGGSGATIAVNTGGLLSGVDLSNLYVSMTDERFGPVGHTDENWQQIMNAGLALPGAHLYRPLTGQTIQRTTAALETWLAEQLDKADYKVALFGMGSDGHTCGIKPNSPAASSTKLAAHFSGDDFERITITFPAIKRIDEAIIQASGPDKRAVIHDLMYDDLPLGDQPAQILKSIPNATLFTNNHEKEL